MAHFTGQRAKKRAAFFKAAQVTENKGFISVKIRSIFKNNLHIIEKAIDGVLAKADNLR